MPVRDFFYAHSIAARMVQANDAWNTEAACQDRHVRSGAAVLGDEVGGGRRAVMKSVFEFSLFSTEMHNINNRDLFHIFVIRFK